MKIINRYLFTTVALISFILMASCNDRKELNQDAPNQLLVELIPDKHTTVKLSEYFKDNYEVIQLKGIVVGNIRHLFYIDSLVILDGRSTEGLLLTFDKDGNYKRTLLRKGQGPREVITLETVKKHNGKVFALVNFGREIWEINPENGDLENKIKMPEEILYPEDFGFIGENIVLFKSNRNLGIEIPQYHLYTYNPLTKKVTGRYYEIDPESSEYISFSINGNIVNDSDSTALYFKSFKQSIDQITQNGLTPYLSFKQNEYSFPEDKLHGKNTFEGFINYCKGSKYIWGHNTISAGNNIIISRFIYDDKVFTNFINKKDTTSQSTLRVIDDIVTGKTYALSDDPWGNVVCTEDHKFYFVYPSGLFQSMQKKEALNNDLFTSANYDTNDLIIILHEK